MNSNQILEHFRQTNALLEGHFILSSGLHSPNYLQCALALAYPFDAVKFGKAIAAHFINEAIETVASPAIGGLVIGYEVAKALNVRFIWTERENGLMTLRRYHHRRLDARMYRGARKTRCENRRRRFDN
jgi:orotate phosphoribosyltransferase